MEEQDRESPFDPTPPAGASLGSPNLLRAKPHPFFDDLEAASPRSVVVPVLIAINIFVFLTMCFAGLDWFSPDTDKMLRWGVDFWPLTTNGQWWRLLTSAFLHFGVFHIGFNMWALYALGKFTERLFGSFFFLLIYLFSAVISGMTSIWREHDAVAAGASGAIFAIAGALAAYLVFQRGVFPMGAARRLLRQTMGFVVLNVVFGFSIARISNSAHLGGLASGFVLGAVMARPLERVRRRRQTLPKFIAGVFVGMTIVIAGMAFIPKCPADDAVITLFHFFSGNINQAKKEGDELVDQAQAGKISVDDFVIRIRKDVLPVWATVTNQLEAIKVDPGLPKAKLCAQLLELCHLNANEYAAIVVSVQKNNIDAYKYYWQFKMQSEALMAQLRTQLHEQNDDVEP